MLKRQPTELEEEFCTFFLEWEEAYKKWFSANRKSKAKAAKGAGNSKTPKNPHR